MGRPIINKFQVLCKTSFSLTFIFILSLFGLVAYISFPICMGDTKSIVTPPKICMGDTKSIVTPPKIILWYIPPRYINSTPGLQPLPACVNSGCRTTTNREYLSCSDVVIFNAQDLTIPSPPQRAHRDQVWVFQNMEPNMKFWLDKAKFRTREWQGVFNWTMWYRRDADLFTPYGFVAKKKTVESKNWTEVVGKKVNKIAWMASNHAVVPSRRQDYVKLLQKYVPVDIYGESHIRTYPRGKMREFLKMAGEKYKFYLSFENSFCEDYMTEKLFLYYKNRDLIPIVRGAGNYSQTLPPGTYIDTADFKTVESLAKHLKYLMNNDSAYIEMLERKHDYTGVYSTYITATNNKVTFIHDLWQEEAMCEMCNRVKNIHKFRKSITNIGDWFDQKKCWSPSDLI